MIELSLEELALLAVGGAMVLAVFFTWISRWSAANAERRSLKRRRSCRLCLSVFESDPRDESGRCPACGAAVDRDGPKPLG